MDKDPEVEVKVQVIEEPETAKVQTVSKKAGESVGHVISSIVDTLEAALSGRGNTVMVRVNDEALKKLDMLVASGICNSRSESAACLLQQGIEHSEALFTRISDVTGQITSMREELQEWVKAGGK